MPEEYINRDKIDLEDNEVAFVLGKGGSTKTKIARAANCRLDMDDRGHLEFSGPPDNCARAREYVELVLAQRKGVYWRGKEGGVSMRRLEGSSKSEFWLRRWGCGGFVLN